MDAFASHSSTSARTGFLARSFQLRFGERGEARLLPWNECDKPSAGDWGSALDGCFRPLLLLHVRVVERVEGVAPDARVRAHVQCHQVRLGVFIQVHCASGRRLLRFLAAWDDDGRLPCEGGLCLRQVARQAGWTDGEPAAGM